MSRRTTTWRKAPRVHPLLEHACRCLTKGRWGCIACTRWHNHYLLVAQRQIAWKADAANGTLRSPDVRLSSAACVEVL